MLWISIGSLGWKWSEQINIDQEGVTTVALCNNIVAIVNIKQLSNLQKQVSIIALKFVKKLWFFVMVIV